MLSEEQQLGLELLQSGENVFLTGGAGSGKSYVIRELMKSLSFKEMPILASTGAAAVILGGRTFHSFFGLGIMEGGFQATYDRVLKDAKTLKRINTVEGCVIDEISMISGEAFQLAELIAQKARQSALPWGGMRMIAVGDFFQLPPVTKNRKDRDWCFLTETWKRTAFQNYQLQFNQRVQDEGFLKILNEIRHGRVNAEVIEFLQKYTQPHDETHPGTRLFPRREQSQFYNQKKLDEIKNEEFVIPAIYFGEERFIEQLKKNSPVIENLKLKVGCRVMFLNNDPQKRWVNGTRGTLVDQDAESLTIRKDHQKLDYGREVTVEKTMFSLLDADGNEKASVIQFPVTLAYATTIHKSQGATLDELWCDLGSLWEPGHAYVALSRLRDASGLHIVRWNAKSIITDPLVEKFYQSF